MILLRLGIHFESGGEKNAPLGIGILSGTGGESGRIGTITP